MSWDKMDKVGVTQAYVAIAVLRNFKARFQI